MTVKKPVAPAKAVVPTPDIVRGPGVAVGDGDKRRVVDIREVLGPIIGNPFPNTCAICGNPKHKVCGVCGN